MLIIVDQSEGCVRWQTHFYFLNGMAAGVYLPPPRPQTPVSQANHI